MSRIKTIQDVDQALELLIGNDKDLARAYQFVQAAGMSVPLRLRPGGFDGLAEIVISQLVSKASANAIHLRFKNHVSPLTPELCLTTNDNTWRTIGLSRPKQATLCAIATALTNHELDLEILGDLPVKEAISHLTAIKGIGNWTAEVYLLFCTGHPDIFPSGDLALREAAKIIWSMMERPRDEVLKSMAARWSPNRGVAARLLWTFYAANRRRIDAMP
ncbi:MAG: DNA-3-methyladenine glycosylase 2 family protein [Hyphomicrobiales bacterium]|nr:DNA-3-methyladenine glycosylase 2 family protein [Hyphomicrobiales bacterium]